MAKFVVVKQAPQKLERGEYVINQPNFMEQVVANVNKAPKHKQTAINNLREVLGSIAEKYYKEMNVFKIKLLNYQGLSFNTNEDISAIIVRILTNEYPQVFSKCLEYQIKSRPMATKLIYYVGNVVDTKPFFDAGLDMIDEDEIESYLTGKPKRVVGKPAITNEEAGNGQDS